jgi:hypothetical protein
VLIDLLATVIGGIVQTQKTSGILLFLGINAIKDRNGVRQIDFWGNNNG